ncbi:MAG: hypothetical protein ACHQAY_19120 [Hyphomicrobiales bacterium]
MSSAKLAETELLEAAARQLAEQGYEVVFEPPVSLVPEALRGLRPDAVAIGRTPKLVIEVAAEGARSAERVAALQRALREEKDWKLYLVFDRTFRPPDLPPASLEQVRSVLGRAEAVAIVDPHAALLMCWAGIEALSRILEPRYFARPQSPGRIVERLASEAKITPTDADFLRAMAQLRNSFAHGDLSRIVTRSEVQRFVALLTDLLDETNSVTAG